MLLKLDAKRRQCRAVGRADLSAAGDHGVEAPKLDEADRRLHLGQARIRTGLDKDARRALAMVAEDAEAVGESVVVGETRPALARGQDLTRME